MSRIVAVVGSFNVDHVWMLDALPVAGETRSARYMSGPGGKGFNQAVAAARSGAATRFICALGEDAGGAYARSLAVADDIDLRDAHSDLPTGSAGIFVDAKGRNSIAVAGGANDTLTAVHVRGTLSGDVPAVVLAQLETPSEAAIEAFALARASGALTMLNPAPANVRVDAALLAATDIVTPNETEFAALVRTHLGRELDADAVRALADPALHAICRELVPNGTVVVTLGSAGAFVSHADSRRRGDDASHYRIPAPKVAVVDTTGAGDAFNGALAASLALRPGQAFAANIRYAIAYASVSTEQPGAAPSMPARDAVHTRFPDAALPA
ncbi:ribokinase [Cognatilysobacter terrigena]|uniref:ribokinase n=1 Tax=Cognatilysobacter terrigena TaxID=2488749 RepID=UPI00105F47F7|nr:ribokinase [Lysobacter terrigena]